jgi:putative membrane protein
MHPIQLEVVRMSHRLLLKPVLGATIALAALSPAVAHGATEPYSPLDEFMLQSSIQGDRFEIAGGRLAESKGTTPAVRNLGARLVKDHSKSLADAAKVAKRLKIFVPKTPSPTQEWELQTLNGLSGPSFDAAYAQLEVQDHKEDIDDNKTEASDGANASVRQLARTSLPVLREHLKLARQARS